MSTDRARVTVRVGVEPEEAFRIFTEEIDIWWRRGLRYRVAATRRGILCLEPRAGGRIFESFEDDEGTALVAETGRVTAWEPPRRLVFEWRAQNFAPTEWTEVEVIFEPRGSATLVTVTHRGWNRIRPDHPARHGLGDAAFLRMMGLWWSDLVTAMRLHAAAGSGPRGG